MEGSAAAARQRRHWLGKGKDQWQDRQISLTSAGLSWSPMGGGISGAGGGVAAGEIVRVAPWSEIGVSDAFEVRVALSGRMRVRAFVCGRVAWANAKR